MQRPLHTLRITSIVNIAGDRDPMEVEELCKEIKENVRGTKEDVQSSLQDIILETVEDGLKHCEMVDDVREILDKI